MDLNRDTYEKLRGEAEEGIEDYQSLMYNIKKLAHEASLKEGRFHTTVYEYLIKRIHNVINKHLDEKYPNYPTRFDFQPNYIAEFDPNLTHGLSYYKNGFLAEDIKRLKLSKNAEIESIIMINLFILKLEEKERDDEIWFDFIVEINEWRPYKVEIELDGEWRYIHCNSHQFFNAFKDSNWRKCILSSERKCVSSEYNIGFDVFNDESKFDNSIKSLWDNYANELECVETPTKIIIENAI